MGTPHTNSYPEGVLSGGVVDLRSGFNTREGKVSDVLSVVWSGDWSSTDHHVSITNVLHLWCVCVCVCASRGKWELNSGNKSDISYPKKQPGL